MIPPHRHLQLVGAHREDRQRALAALLPPDATSIVTAVCHQRLRGPYTGVDSMLRAVLPHAVASWPELVERHRVELLYGMPELADVIGPAPATLSSSAPFAQRTRFYGHQMIRCMNQGMVTFLVDHARRRADARLPQLCLVFEDLHAAEATTQEFVALLARRSDPVVLRVVASASAVPLTSELEIVLGRVADVLPCEPDGARNSQPRDHDELVRAYVFSDGSTDDPAEVEAYHQADQALVQALHDERADALEPGAGWGTLVGAISYHRERGSSPRDQGRAALDRAFQFCVEAGLSAAVVDLGMRGRAVTDPVAHRKQFVRFSQHAASALVALGRPAESLTLYEDLRRRYKDAKVHMTCSYSIAMLYTRFFEPRDHETALAWQHNACALASQLPDPDDRRTYEVFHANGLALVEMHRGNLDRALELVDGGIARLDRELDGDDWALHRSQLLYNRTRLLAAMGRAGEADAGFSRLIELDPYYTDYLSERAKQRRKLGDLGGALLDYDRAVQLGPPFPELYYNRGTARLALGDIDGALADFGYVLDMEPDDVDTRISRAELLLAEGDADAAMADVAEGLRLRPDEPRLLAMQGTVALEQGWLEDAVRYLDSALAIAADYPAALINRAVAEFQLGCPAAAIRDLTRALDVIGLDPDVLLNRGLAHAAHGQVELALADFDAAFELPDADLPELRYQRGRCLLQAGQHRQAESDLRECLNLGVHEDEVAALLAAV